MSAVDHRRQTPYSDPGGWVDLITDVPADPVALSAVARNLIVHYRSSGLPLPAETRNDVHSRWLHHILSIDQARHGKPLAEHREPLERVQGCCRDHTLFCVGVLRQHGVAARSRVGFAGYFRDDHHVDHVVVEARVDGRWCRFDSEIEHLVSGIDPFDLRPVEPDGRGFVTAAEAWVAHRKGSIDAAKYGVDPDIPPLNGERFLFNEVIYEVAHRYGDELLLWDVWGRMGPPGEPVSDDDARWLDHVAGLLMESDGGDSEAESTLLDRYRSDAGLHPGSRILRVKDFGDELIDVNLV